MAGGCYVTLSYGARVSEQDPRRPQELTLFASQRSSRQSRPEHAGSYTVRVQENSDK
jgi:hypothetical protein